MAATPVQKAEKALETARTTVRQWQDKAAGARAEAAELEEAVSRIHTTSNIADNGKEQIAREFIDTNVYEEPDVKLSDILTASTVTDSR